MFRLFWGEVEQAKVKDEEIESLSKLANETTPEAALDLRRTLEVLFQKHTPLDVSSYKRCILVSILLKAKAWPVETKVSAYKDIWKTKEEFLEIFDCFVDQSVSVKVNALLQSLCKQTFLGNIFHTARLYSEPSVASGHLYKIASTLQAVLTEKNKAGLLICEDTIDALKAEAKRNPAFSQSLIPFPSLHDLVSGRIEQDVERKYGY